MGDILAIALQRVDHCIDHRRGRANRPSLAAAFHAQRVVRTGRLTGMIDRIAWQIVGAWHCVIHEGSGLQLAIFVISRAFQQRLSNALRQSAMHLALDDHRVDDIAKIIRRRETVDGDMAGFRIDLDLQT